MVVSAKLLLRLRANQWPILSSLATTILDGPFSPSCAPRQGTSAKHAGRCVFGTPGSSSSTSVMDSRPTARSATGTATWGRGVSFPDQAQTNQRAHITSLRMQNFVPDTTGVPAWRMSCSWTIAIPISGTTSYVSVRSPYHPE